MSGFVRPELRAALWRWREVLAGLAVAAGGTWLARLPGPALQIVGVLAALVGLGLALVGWRRLRFRGRGLAPGVVTVDEGQIGYFGPSTGGIVALGQLAELRLRNDGDRLAWVLVSPPDALLTIPHGARGAELLFDVLSSLPGLSAERLLRAVEAPGTGTAVIWQRPQPGGLTPLR